MNSTKKEYAKTLRTLTELLTFHLEAAVEMYGDKYGELLRENTSLENLSKDINNWGSL